MHLHMSFFLCTFVRFFRTCMRIALIGYGKMGHMIESIALERGHEIVARIDAGDAFLLNGADVAIEFTTPATAKDNILRAWAQGVPVVSGTTGWRPEEIIVEARARKELKIKNSKFKIEGSRVIIEDEKGKTMLVWSSNFSVGVNIFFDLNQFLAKEMDNEKLKMENGKCLYTPSITEIHHIHKLDKPSGTAKTLANDIMSAVSPLNGDAALNGVPIESIREGEVPGTHEVQWDSEEDTIIITHIAKGRRGFALGAVLAAESLI